MGWSVPLLLLQLMSLGFSQLTPHKAFIEKISTKPRVDKYLAFSIKLTVPSHVTFNVDAAKTLIHKLSKKPKLTEVQQARILALNYTINEYANTSAIMEHTVRTRRGLLDVGGVLIKGVFGLATENDVKTLQQATKNSTEQIITTQKAILVETDVLKGAIQKLNIIISQEIGKSGSLLEGIFVNLETSDQIALVTETLQNVQAIFNRYEILINHLQEGLIDTFVTPKILHKLVEANRENIDPALRMPCDLESQCDINSVISISSTSNDFLYLAKLPLVTKEKFNIYEFSAIPTADEDRKYYVPINMYKFLGWNNESYFTANNLDCTKWYCSAITEVISIKIPSCNMELFKNSAMTPSCKYKELNTNFYFMSQSSLSWVIYFFQSTDVTIACPNTEKVRHVQAKGLFTVKKNCKIYSGLVQLTIPEQVIEDHHIDAWRSPASNYFHLHSNISSELANSTENFRIYKNLQKEIIAVSKNLEKNITHVKQQTKLILTSDMQIGVNAGTLGIVVIALLVFAVIIWRRRPQRDINLLEKQNDVLRLNVLSTGTL